MKIFISYNRKDHSGVRAVVTTLRDKGHEVWFDQDLLVGQIWWSEICDHIEHADAVVLALSPDFLDSPACANEWHYARALGTPLLPVVVAPVNLNVLPTELAGRQVLDFGRPGARAALDAAVRGLPRPQRPGSPPARPPVPRSVFVDMRDRICSQTLSREEQLAIVAEFMLGTRSDDVEEQRAARELLVSASRSPFLFDGPARLIRDATVPVTQKLPAASLAVIGTAIGCVGFTDALWLAKVYPIVANVVSRGDTGPIAFSLINLVLAVVGSAVCLWAWRRHTPGARPALALCLVSAVFALLDTFHVQVWGHLLGH